MLTSSAVDFFSGDDQFYLSNKSDTASSASGHDVIWGYDGDDILSGQGGDDTIWGGAGFDILDGGPGVDTAEYLGSQNNYTVIGNSEAAVILDHVSGDGDFIKNFEILAFNANETPSLITMTNALVDSNVFSLVDDLNFIPHPHFTDLENSQVYVDAEFGFFLLSMDWNVFDGVVNGLNLDPTDGSDQYAIRFHDANEIISDFSSYNWQESYATNWFDHNGDLYLAIFDPEIKLIDWNSANEAITFGVSDGASWVAETFFISFPNEAPMLTTASALSTNEDTASSSIAFSATDPDGDALHYTFSDPTKGSVTNNGNGTYTYTPDADANGSDNFTITVNDGTVDVSQTVDVTINAVNDTPILATASTLSTNEDTASSAIAFSATDVDGNNLEYSFSKPSRGSAPNNGDGTYTYTPDANANGSDNFTITVNDGTVDVSQTVDVTINAVVHNTEFQVNTYVINAQDESSIAGLTGGEFVVVWQSLFQDGSSYGVYGQIYSASGRALSDEFRVNTYVTDIQNKPSVAGLSDGGFVVSWNSQDQDGEDLGIFGQRYDQSGNIKGAEFQINTYTEQNQTTSSVTNLDDGGFVVTWDNNGQDRGIYGQRYDDAANAVLSEFQISSSTSYFDGSKVANLSDGGFVVTWSDYIDSNTLVVGQRFDSSGNKAGSKFQLEVGEHNYNEFVTGLRDGGFVIAWQSNTGDGGLEDNPFNIYGQRFLNSGVTNGNKFQINTHETGEQSGPVIAALDNGAFVVVWHSSGQDDGGSDWHASGTGGIYGQRYDSSGNAAGVEFQINTFETGWQGRPSITGLSDGGFVVSWTDKVQDGSEEGIYGQRYDSEGNATTYSGHIIEPRVDLTDAQLAGIDLSNADLTSANLTGAELTGANLTNAKIDLNDWKWLSPDQQAVAQLVEPLITDTFAITVAPAISGSGNRYIINGAEAPMLNLELGKTYVFDLSDGSTGNHPLLFSVKDTVGNTTILTDEFISTGTRGSDQKIYFTVPKDVEGTIEYYCERHANMGNDIGVTITNQVTDDLFSGSELSEAITAGEGADLIEAGSGEDTIHLFSSEVWSFPYFAQNIISGEQLSLAGKTKFSSVIDGEEDADTLNLTDSTAGDAFFLHDSYSGLHDSLTAVEDGMGRTTVARAISLETINAGDGDDVIDLTSPTFDMGGISMTINGEAGNDTIWAAEGDDELYGGDDDDILYGGEGNDILTGGSGADIFEFKSSNITQIDRITDYTAEDTLKFYLQSGDSELSSANLSGGNLSWGNLTIDFGDTSIPSFDDLNIAYDYI